MAMLVSVTGCATRLDSTQESKQKLAVLSALNGDYGDEYKWYEGDAMGIAKAVHGYPQGSGICKVVWETVYKGNKKSDFERTACVEWGHQGWRFIKK
jgi:hypothetical protein